MARKKKEFEVKTRWINVGLRWQAREIASRLEKHNIEVYCPTYPYKNSVAEYDFWWKPKNEEEYQIGLQIQRDVFDGRWPLSY